MSDEHIFTDDNFEKEVLKSDLPVLVDFYAEWCGPCKMLSPIVDEIAREMHGSWKVGKLNIDDNPKMTAEYGVQSIPTLLLIRNGQVEQKIMGFQSKEALMDKLKI